MTAHVKRISTGHVGEGEPDRRSYGPGQPRLDPRSRVPGIIVETALETAAEACCLLFDRSREVTSRRLNDILGDRWLQGAARIGDRTCQRMAAFSRQGASTPKSAAARCGSVIGSGRPRPRVWPNAAGLRLL